MFLTILSYQEINVLTETWNQVENILDFVNSARIDSFGGAATGVFIVDVTNNIFKTIFIEYFWVRKLQIKDWTVIWSQVLLIIGVLTWPIVKIKRIIKNIRFQDISNVDTLFNDSV